VPAKRETPAASRPHRFIEARIGAGLHTVEVGAFVSPKAIPQMMNSDQVLRGVSHHPDSEFHVLVPNEKAYDAARAAGARVIAVFASASEAFRGPISIARSPNPSTASSLSWSEPGGRHQGPRLYLLRARCPYDGEVKPQAVVDVAKLLWISAANEVSLWRHHRRRYAAQGAASATPPWPA